MWSAAIPFSNTKIHNTTSAILSEALEYGKQIGQPQMNHPADEDIPSIMSRDIGSNFLRRCSKMSSTQSATRRITVAQLPYRRLVGCCFRSTSASLRQGAVVTAAIPDMNSRNCSRGNLLTRFTTQVALTAEHNCSGPSGV